MAAKIGEPEFYYDAGYQDDDAKTSVAWRMTRRDANGKNVALVIYDWKHWNYRGKEINRNEVIRFHAVCDKPDLFPEFAFLKRANYLNQVKN